MARLIGTRNHSSKISDVDNHLLALKRRGYMDNYDVEHGSDTSPWCIP
jgi:hypothetical protein